MVGNVGAAAAAHEEATGEVDPGGEPWMGGVLGLRFEPEKSVHGVFVGGGETVFRGEAVVDGDDEGGDLGGEGGAGVVEEGGG